MNRISTSQELDYLIEIISNPWLKETAIHGAAMAALPKTLQKNHWQEMSPDDYQRLFARSDGATWHRMLEELKRKNKISRGTTFVSRRTTVSGSGVTDHFMLRQSDIDGTFDMTLYAEGSVYKRSEYTGQWLVYEKISRSGSEDSTEDSEEVYHVFNKIYHKTKFAEGQ